MIKAWIDTRNYDWESYANDERGAMNALRQAWRVHKRGCDAAGMYGLMPESEFLEDISYLEIPTGTIKKRIAFCDRDVMWVEGG